MSEPNAHAPVTSKAAPDDLDDDQRSRMLSQLTGYLVMFMVGLLACVVFVFFVLVPGAQAEATEATGSHTPTYLTFMVFALGLSGGFVSIQQRMDRIGDAELRHLTTSWYTILLVPVYGGVFALLLHVVFVAELVTGAMFPRYWTPDFGDTPTPALFFDFFQQTLPLTAQDTARMIFWAFASGFSERLVPQVIRSTSRSLESAVTPSPPGTAETAPPPEEQRHT